LQASRERQTMNGAYYGECDLVADLMFSHEGVPQTRQSIVEISRNTGILQSTISRVIRDLLRAAHQGEDNVTICVADVFTGSVGSQGEVGNNQCV